MKLVSIIIWCNYLQVYLKCSKFSYNNDLDDMNYCDIDYNEISGKKKTLCLWFLITKNSIKVLITNDTIDCKL